jgi:hypothetical protein
MPKLLEEFLRDLQSKKEVDAIKDWLLSEDAVNQMLALLRQLK